MQRLYINLLYIKKQTNKQSQTQPGMKINEKTQSGYSNGGLVRLLTVGNDVCLVFFLKRRVGVGGVGVGVGGGHAEKGIYMAGRRF